MEQGCRFAEALTNIVNPSSDNPQSPPSGPSSDGGAHSATVCYDPPWRTAQLRDWKREWDIHCKLKETDDGEESRSEPSAGAGPVRPVELPEGLLKPFDASPESVKPGSVRLLASEVVPDADRPVFVLVVMDWDEDHKLVAPFSPLRIPATTMEFRTSRELPLEVVELWNVRAMPDQVLAKSWLVDTFSDEELEEVRAVWDHARGVTPLPGHLRTQVGCRIDDESDPRRAYQEEEKQLFDAFDAQVFASLAAEPLPAPATIVPGQLWEPATAEAAVLLIVGDRAIKHGAFCVEAVLCSPADEWPKRWESGCDVFFAADEAGSWVAHFSEGRIAMLENAIERGRFLGSVPKDAVPHSEQGAPAVLIPTGLRANLATLARRLAKGVEEQRRSFEELGRGVAEVMEDLLWKPDLLPAGAGGGMESLAWLASCNLPDFAAALRERRLPSGAVPLRSRIEGGEPMPSDSGLGETIAKWKLLDIPRPLTGSEIFHVFHHGSRRWIGSGTVTRNGVASLRVGAWDSFRDVPPHEMVLLVAAS